MSGRRIDDHTNWTGKAPSGQVYPDGAKMKHYKSVEGSGHLGMDYPDTTEMVERNQDKGVSQAEKHKTKPGYRY